MKKSITAQINMANTTVQYSDQNVGITALVPAFAIVLADTKAKLITINNLNQLIIPGTKGVTIDMRQVQAATTNLTLKCSNALTAYANDIEDATLLEQVNYSPSDLKRLKKDDFDDVCQTIHDLADENIADAADFGYSAADVTALQTGIDLYRAVQQNPRQAKISIASANSQIATLIKAILQKNFKGKMDKMVNTLKTTQPIFVSEYFMARIIVDLPSSSAHLTGVAKDDPTQLPLGGVLVEVFPVGTTTPVKQTTTNLQGIYIITPLPPGDYTARYSKPDYVILNKNFTITAGQEVIINPFLTPQP